MLSAKDIMTQEVITVKNDTEIGVAAKLLIENGINGVPVTDDEGKITGILCQSDLIAQQKRLPIPNLFTILDGIIPLNTKQLDHEVQKMTARVVSQAMTSKPKTVTINTSIEDIASLMVDKHFHTIPVVENDKIVGVIGKEDILKTLLPKST